MLSCEKIMKMFYKIKYKCKLNSVKLKDCNVCMQWGTIFKCSSTRKHKKTDKESSCLKHTQLHPGHYFNYDDIEIIDRTDTDQKLRYKELLHILKQKPELNKQLNSQSNFDTKTLIIQAYPQYREKKSAEQQ